MDGLLTAVKTVKRDQDPSLVATDNQSRGDSEKPIIDFDQQDISAEHAIDVLRSSPDCEALSDVLAAIDPFDISKKIKNFDIRIPSPKSAQILQILVSTTIPDHWASLNAKSKTPKETKSRAAILRCLNNVAGLGSLVAQLRSLMASARASIHQAKSSSSSLAIRELLSVLASLLEPKEFVFRLYSDTSSLQKDLTKVQVVWRELVSLIGAGKILSTTAEALTIVNDSEFSSSISWVGEGLRYAAWAGKNIAFMASKLGTDDEAGWGSLAFLTGRGLSLGYAGKYFHSFQDTYYLLTCR